MFDLRKIPVLRVLIPFFGGVLTGKLGFSSLQILDVVIISLFLWVAAVLFFLWTWKWSGLTSRVLIPVLFLLFFMNGVGTGYLSRPADPGLPVGEQVLIRGVVRESPHPVKNFLPFDLELNLLYSEDTLLTTSTFLQVYLWMPTDSVIPAEGEMWQFSGQLVPIANSGNPGTPDFKTMLNRKNCWYRFYVSSGTGSALSNRRVTGKGRRLTPESIRKKVSDQWHGETEEISLLKAVCLGDRSSLSGEMLQNYTLAGGLHLLAVSGLHVGLIWWVLQYMTGWMRIIFRSEKQRMAAVVGLLWFYAFVTGFSSSVCRSVTMFSFFSMSRMMGHRIHAVNGILVSAFLLVLIDPHKLLDIGFQLSYTAILGIVTLHPVISRVVRIRNRVLKRVWEAISIGLAAQISTAPLVIFYFHQLPLYSFITNLAAVPLLSVLIAVFVCSIPFISAGLMVKFFNFILVELALLMNRSMEFLSSIPGALMEGLQVDWMTLAIWLIILLLIMIVFHIRSRIPWYMVLFLTSYSLTWNAFSGLNRRSSSEFVITHFNGASLIIIREGAMVDHYYWCRDSASMDRIKGYIDHAWDRKIYHNQLFEISETAEFKGRVSSCMPLGDGLWLLGCYRYRGLVVRGNPNQSYWEIDWADQCGGRSGRPGVILFSGEPRVDWILNNSQASDVDLVIDGSNRSRYINRVRAEREDIYLTDRYGAYVKRW
jgi:competence protein ComEC